MKDRYTQIAEHLDHRASKYYQANNLSYHNNDHVKSMFRQAVFNFGMKLDEKQLVVLCLAIAYHDVVYVPGAAKSLYTSNVNEELSALTFLKDYKDLTAPDERDLIDYETVMDLIRATWWENHVSETYKAKTYLEGVLLDVDIHSLAKPWDEFFFTQRDIIRENIGQNETITDEHFQMSATFLKKFLKREFIYHTDIGRFLWETKARANITRYVAEYPPIE